jgi:endo-alpha-1,4-polygalactosaminidase (GH114 family)
VVVAVNEFGTVRWSPGAAEFMTDQMNLFDERGMNHALWDWAPAWEYWTEEVNEFNFRFGPDPSNITDDLSNDLMRAITANWSRNTLRPSNWAFDTEDTSPSPDAEQPTELSGDWWKPSLETTWQWHLSEAIDTSFDVNMYDVDLFETEASMVQILKDQGRAVICYISVGSWEDWRPDVDQFPIEVVGNDYEGWPGEKWLDIRQIDLLAPIMRARLDECASKGFAGIEPDNIDGYTNDTGFPLTYADQLAYNIWLAEEAHARGLSIGLKNDSEQVADLLPYYDWAMTEDCFDEGWCEEMLPFIEAGKPVFAAEYTDTGITLNDFCPQANEMNISAIFKNRDLDAYREVCH